MTSALTLNPLILLACQHNNKIINNIYIRYRIIFINIYMLYIYIYKSYFIALIFRANFVDSEKTLKISVFQTLSCQQKIMPILRTECIFISLFAILLYCLYFCKNINNITIWKQRTSLRHLRC